MLTYVGSWRCHTRNLFCNLVPHMFLSQKADGPRHGADRRVDRADRPLPTELAAFLGTGAPPVHAGVGSMPMPVPPGYSIAWVDLPFMAAGLGRWWLAGLVLLKIVYLLMRCLFGLTVLVFRGDQARDAELLVLRHENAVLRRHTDRVRYEPGDRACSPRWRGSSHAGLGQSFL